MPTKVLRRMALAAAVAWLSAPQAAAQVVVILSAKNSIGKLTPDQVSQLFLGQANTFYTGWKAEPLDLPEASPIRQAFYQKATGKNAAQLKAHWSKQTFSGNGQPPAVIATPAELVKLVATHPKFIAYVDKSAVDETVKVVLSF